MGTDDGLISTVFISIYDIVDVKWQNMWKGSGRKNIGLWEIINWGSSKNMAELNTGIVKYSS